MLSHCIVTYTIARSFIGTCFKKCFAGVHGNVYAAGDSFRESILLPCGSPGVNCHQVWSQVPSPSEPRQWPLDNYQLPGLSTRGPNHLLTLAHSRHTEGRHADTPADCEGSRDAHSAERWFTARGKRTWHSVLVVPTCCSVRKRAKPLQGGAGRSSKPGCEARIAVGRGWVQVTQTETRAGRISAFREATTSSFCCWEGPVLPCAGGVSGSNRAWGHSWGQPGRRGCRKGAFQVHSPGKGRPAQGGSGDACGSPGRWRGGVTAANARGTI